MKRFLRILKRILFWSYGRSTWQYDILCALILAFVFLTPKSWFETGELRHAGTHQIRVPATRLVFGAEVLQNSTAKTDIERRARVITNRPDATVTHVQPIVDASGKVIACEVEIQ